MRIPGSECLSLSSTNGSGCHSSASFVGPVWRRIHYSKHCRQLAIFSSYPSGVDRKIITFYRNLWGNIPISTVTGAKNILSLSYRKNLPGNQLETYYPPYPFDRETPLYSTTCYESFNDCTLALSFTSMMNYMDN